MSSKNMEQICILQLLTLILQLLHLCFKVSLLNNLSTFPAGQMIKGSFLACLQCYCHLPLPYLPCKHGLRSEKPSNCIHCIKSRCGERQTLQFPLPSAIYFCFSHYIMTNSQKPISNDVSTYKLTDFSN